MSAPLVGGGGPVAYMPPVNPRLARAERATPFHHLVLVELRKLTGTRSDRVLLVIGTIVLLSFVPLIAANAESASTFASAKRQLFVTVVALRLGHSIVHGALIKLVAGEWQHRGVQPTLLAQPSRVRYFLSQTTVVVLLWLYCATLQVASSVIAVPVLAYNSGTLNLLSYRVGWVIGVCFLGSLLTLVVALTVAMLVPNAAGALAIYYVTVPLTMLLDGLAPSMFGWIDPLVPMLSLADAAPVAGTFPPILSLLLWVGLLVFAGHRVMRRDVS